MLQDVSYAWRMLVKSPWVTLAVLLSLGLGIGANVTIFSWVRAVLLEPFGGVPEQRNLVIVNGRRHGGIPSAFSYPDYLDLRQQADAFEGLVAVGPGPGYQVSLGAEQPGEFAEQIVVRTVSAKRRAFYRYLQAIVDAGFASRVMFGSDQMVWPGVLERAIAVIEEAPFLSAEQKRDILYNNAARFMRLSAEEIARHHGKASSGQ